MKYKEMVKDINKLVETEFCEEMSWKTIPRSRPYTQKEAVGMANILGSIYLISHSPRCVCGAKYK